MPGYGRQIIGVVGNSIGLIATDFEDARWKVGGCTLDWLSVAAVSGSDVVLTGGTTVVIGQKYVPLGTVMNLLTSGANAGKYAPYNSAGTHGEAALTRDSVLMTEDWLQNAPMALTTNYATDYFGGLQAGTVWFARLQIGGAGQPTQAAFEAAFPGILYARM
jgi:hypothetical protein